MSRSNPDKPETPSKLLREAIFKLWKKDPEGYEDFDEYYKNLMNKIIIHFNSKLIKK